MTEPYFQQVACFTVLLAASVTVLTLVLAYPLALFLHGLPNSWRNMALAGVVLPKLASVLVVLYGLQLLLGNNGPINRFLLALGLVGKPMTLFHNRVGVVIGETYLLVPYAVLVLLTALDRIDPNLVAAARGLGAGPWQVFWRIRLPLSLPGVFLAGQLTIIWALGALLGPILLGGPDEITLAVEVQRQALENNHWPRGAALAVLMLLLLVGCLLLVALPLRWRRRQRPA